MCLNKVFIKDSKEYNEVFNSLKKSKKFPDTFIGYKEFDCEKVKNNILELKFSYFAPDNNPIPKNKWINEKDFRMEYNKRKKYIRNGNITKYPFGFHIYLNKYGDYLDEEDIQYYNDEQIINNQTYIMQKIYFKNIVAIGTEELNCYSTNNIFVIVATDIYIPSQKIIYL